ncbi:hypothetical protein DPMN_066600 [Dreissena polymorpha]|uniref:Uncharacterized protein n=1 Tax=Dreissena polymorpha TaxID=45954 RepID=A0A9D3YYR6_DREPO|nr:hypothetical protein DPMN_066600 [Dreissena polymorpha]
MKKLKYTEIAETFQTRMDDKFKAIIILNIGIDTITNHIKEALLSLDKAVLERNRIKNKPSVTTEIMGIWDKSRERYTSQDSMS